MTHMTNTRYSPDPIDSYRFATLFKFLVDDPVAWDLAYLSWDFEASKEPPDPQFSTNVRRTLQFMPGNGLIDLTNEAPPEQTVRGLVLHPPPRAVNLILGLPKVQELPMFKAYGKPWVTTLMSRSRLYREPHDEAFDFEIKVVTQATEVIAKIR